MNWTKEQQQVIDLRNRNILVSAAAGSGKTAVLVERIIKRISEDTPPLNIDELLVVTFTKAAALEMRERISNAIDKKRAENPNNIHLQKQTALLHNAKIMTIDGFCLDVIRNYFHLIDLDPGFRIADEAELVLLKSDVLGEVLERRYEMAEEEFIEFVECYTGTKSDKKLEEYIFRLYEFSMSYPWPMEWLKDAGEKIHFESVESMLASEFMNLLITDIKELIKCAIQINEKAIIESIMPDGPYMYRDALISDAELLSELMYKENYIELAEGIKSVTFEKLHRKRDPFVSEKSRELVKNLRQQVKDIINDIKKTYFFQPLSEMFFDLCRVKKPMQMLIDLTIEFADEFAKKKEEKNIIDFHDMEHFALRILLKRENGFHTRTQAAKDLSKEFAEIMIDEYQDSNYVQEEILNSISRIEDNNPNVFMVGDVKQSIYKFRLARPQLFMDKYEKYLVTDSDYQRIDLHKNFRSRAIVLSSINKIFEKIMIKGFGGIEYDEDVALYPGADFSISNPDTLAYQTEVILVTDFKEKDKKEETTKEADNKGLELDPYIKELREEEEDYNKKELEALAVAKRIKELISNDDSESQLMIFNKGKKQKVQYKDIVILLRTMSGWSEIFTEILLQQGIPAYAETRTGYFKTREIKIMLSLLRILDNPRQDIPFASVLYSPLVELTSNELAQIRNYALLANGKKQTMYEAALFYCEERAKDKSFTLITETKLKLLKFFNIYNKLRKQVPHMAVHELIQEIFKLTGFDYYVLAMPSGEQRKRNLDMLIKQAKAFEQSSYHGLFQFVRYVDRLIKYEIDYGESGTMSEQEAVRIMSIHKSKGLEFPVVILSGMGKKFNQSDARASLVLHPDYGIGPDCIDYKMRTKIPTLLKKVIQKRSNVENLSEELRILYVAMTRAKEKLIMTGYVKNPEKEKAKWENTTVDNSGQLSYYTLASAGTFFSFVGPAIISNNEVSLSVINTSDLTFYEMNQMWKKQIKQEDFLLSFKQRTSDDVVKQELLHELNYNYPYNEEMELPIKTSVSELKKQSMHEEESFEYKDLLELKTEDNKQVQILETPLIPKFLEENSTITGSNRGTLYHKIMEHISFTRAAKVLDRDLSKFITDELERFIREEKITIEEKQSIRVGSYVKFFRTDLAKRMIRAAMFKKLYKEMRFVLLRPASEIKPSYQGDATVLLQGIMDAYFEEEGELILVDYKTDMVSEIDGEQVLKNRYSVQMDLYSKALSQLTGKNIKERLIYSFHLSKVIQV